MEIAILRQLHERRDAEEDRVCVIRVAHVGDARAVPMGLGPPVTEPLPRRGHSCALRRDFLDLGPGNVGATDAIAMPPESMQHHA